MFINPKIAITEGWITHPELSTYDDWLTNKFVSPNAIDFTLDRLFTINHHNGFHISEQGKKMRGGQEIEPVIDRRENIPYWRIEGDSVYDGLSSMYVNIPDGVAAWIITRSTFSRNGIFIQSGLWDSKFSGNLGMAIHNRSGYAYVSPGTRIGQVIFVQSDNELQYAGGYNHEAGTHWTESKTQA